MDVTKYKTHVFSLHPLLQPTNDLTEEQVAQAFADLMKEWDKEAGAFIPDSEKADDQERKEDVRNDLRNKNGVYVLIEERKSQKIAGFGELVNETTLKEHNGPYFGRAYILPKHRRQGLFTEIAKTIGAAGEKIGYKYILAEPNKVTRLVGEKFNGTNIGTEYDVLLKIGITSQAPEKPTPPQFRK